MSDHTPRKGRLTAHSPRELESWARCPRLWWWLYPQEGRHTLPTTSAARRGIALHEAIAAGIASGNHGDHPVVAAALEYLGGRSATTEGQYESGLLMGRVDALLGDEVIDWKTIETNDGETTHSGRLPGIQGEVYCRLTGADRATVVEIDEFGEWEATSARVGDAAWALFVALVGVEWGWEQHQRGAAPMGRECRHCLECPAAGTCEKEINMTTKEQFDSLPEETRQHILRALNVSSFDEAESRFAKALPNIIEAQASKPAEAPKPKKTKAAPVVEDAVEQARRLPDAPITREPEPVPVVAAPPPVQAPPVATVPFVEPSASLQCAPSVKCIGCGAIVTGEHAAMATPMCAECIAAQAATMRAKSVAKVMTIAAPPPPAAPAPTDSVPDFLVCGRVSAPSGPVPSRIVVEALVRRLTTVPREQWPMMTPAVMDAVAEGVAAARRASWRTASTAARLELLQAQVVPLSDGNVRAIAEAEDVTIEQLAILADLTVAPF